MTYMGCSYKLNKQGKKDKGQQVSDESSWDEICQPAVFTVTIISTDLCTKLFNTHITAYYKQTIAVLSQSVMIIIIIIIITKQFIKHTKASTLLVYGKPPAYRQWA